jgi:hypothetical protein
MKGRNPGTETPLATIEPYPKRMVSGEIAPRVAHNIGSRPVLLALVKTEAGEARCSAPERDGGSVAAAGFMVVHLTRAGVYGDSG